MELGSKGGKQSSQNYVDNDNKLNNKLLSHTARGSRGCYFREEPTAGKSKQAALSNCILL